MRLLIAALALAAMAAGARADIPPPGGGRPQPREVVVTGTVTALAGTQLTLAAPGGQPQTFALAGETRADGLGLRVGDTAAVTLRGFGNPFAAPVAWVDRVLPVGDLRLRVYAAGVRAAPPALSHGQGCWVSSREGESIELCFTSVSRGVALRYRPDGTLACSAPLSVNRLSNLRFAAQPASCRDGSSWPLQSVDCDGKDSCRLALSGQQEQVLAMTRR